MISVDSRQVIEQARIFFLHRLQQQKKRRFRNKNTIANLLSFVAASFLRAKFLLVSYKLAHNFVCHLCLKKQQRHIESAHRRAHKKNLIRPPLLQLPPLPILFGGTGCIDGGENAVGCGNETRAGEQLKRRDGYKRQASRCRAPVQSEVQETNSTNLPNAHCHLLEKKNQMPFFNVTSPLACVAGCHRPPQRW